jgi:hypothetical protein
MLEGHFGSPSASEHWQLASWQTRLTEFKCEQLRQELAEQATRIAELEVSSAPRLEDVKTELGAARSWRRRIVKNTESKIADASSDSGVELKDDMLIEEVVMYRIIFIDFPYTSPLKIGKFSGAP